MMMIRIDGSGSRNVIISIIITWIAGCHHFVDTLNECRVRRTSCFGSVHTAIVRNLHAVVGIVIAAAADGSATAGCSGVICVVVVVIIVVIVFCSSSPSPCTGRMTSDEGARTMAGSSTGRD